MKVALSVLGNAGHLNTTCRAGSRTRDFEEHLKITLADWQQDPVDNDNASITLNYINHVIR
jgi:hypothetical protein